MISLYIVFSHVYSEVLTSITLTGYDIDSQSSYSLPLLGTALLRARIHSLPSNGILYWNSGQDNNGKEDDDDHANNTSIQNSQNNNFDSLHQNITPIKFPLNCSKCSVPLPLKFPFTLYYRFIGNEIASTSHGQLIGSDSFNFSVEDTANSLSLVAIYNIEVIYLFPYV